MGIEAKLVEVIDNNCIDRELHKFKPSYVFIEALWVVPEKFHVLISLHPHIKWHVRLHSNVPFIANEGIAMEWLVKYKELQKRYPQFHISPNSIDMCNALKKTLNIDTIYSPNIYQPYEYVEEKSRSTPIDKHPKILDIGCFGAIRPMKNQLIQAMAAIAFANEYHKVLRFHINATRIEQKGENAYKNIVSLFKGTKHKLVEHDWLNHDLFVKLVEKMDLGMQVSFTETFNIVAADFVYNGVPLVGSPEITWMNSVFQANPTNLDDIVKHLWVALVGRKLNVHRINKWGLDKYNNESKEVWKEYLNV